ncbi:MAG TPA: NADH-quinone oxidoreductase subunit M [Verrucomicrobiae bacterium]|jgi:NADH-quinone oxidoreductase subunit M|nr:NADH-quinone oxidoreductase subunit M [Verrucomicrobiae bacterium]
MILSILTFLPLAVGVLVALLGPDRQKLGRNLAFATSLLALAVAVGLWASFDNAKAGMQFVESVSWVPSLGIEYHLGLDGLGLIMVLLSALIVPFAMLASWKIENNPKLYFSLMLFLEAGLFGTFTAQNFIHWFLFWELSLIPAFFLIRIWGGPKRAYAASQVFIYTMGGSVAMLAAFLALYATTDASTRSFDFAQLAATAHQGGLFAGHKTLATAIFLGVLLGLAVKVPLVPFHTWLPAAYSEAPTGTAMLLTGAMSKMGVYGFLRVLCPIFPEQMQAWRTPLLVLAAATIVLPAAAAFAQKDLKRMVAYSSINHLGYCLLGIFAAAGLTDGSALFPNEQAAALNGVILQMFNHGLTASALFYFVGLIEQRGGARGLNDFGGLRQAAPVFCGLMGIALFASLGLPGLNGFPGEFLIFKGTLHLAERASVLSIPGLLLTAIFLLTILQRVFSGPLAGKWNGWPDLTLGERLTVLPVVALMFVFGIFPQLLTGLANLAVLQMLKSF